MRPDLQQFVDQEREIASREGSICLIIDASSDLDSERRESFLNAMRRHGHRSRSIKTRDYVVCFRGTVHEGYRFLECLLQEVNRLNADSLQSHVDDLQQRIQFVIALVDVSRSHSHTTQLN